MFFYGIYNHDTILQFMHSQEEKKKIDFISSNQEIIQSLLILTELMFIPSPKDFKAPVQSSLSHSLLEAFLCPALSTAVPGTRAPNT